MFNRNEFLNFFISYLGSYSGSYSPPLLTAPGQQQQKPTFTYSGHEAKPCGEEKTTSLRQDPTATDSGCIRETRVEEPNSFSFSLPPPPLSSSVFSQPTYPRTSPGDRGQPPDILRVGHARYGANGLLWHHPRRKVSHAHLWVRWSYYRVTGIVSEYSLPCYLRHRQAAKEITG